MRPFVEGWFFIVVLCIFGPTRLYAQERPIRTVEQLTRAIDLVVEAPPFDNAFWGIQVVDLASGDVLYERNAEKSFEPASGAKLFTTAAALDMLGPEYRYVTHVYADGTVISGTLNGNVIVRGSGDPTIGARFHDDEHTRVFEQWADSLKAAGITRIAGDLIGDDNVFDDVPYGRGWSWNDLRFYYAAEIGGLSFNENVVDFAIRGRRVGQPGDVSWEPYDTDYVEVINNTVTIGARRSIDEGYERALSSNTIELSSEVPSGRTDEEALSIYNPTLYFMHVLRETLRRNDISVRGAPVDVDDLMEPPDYTNPALRHVASYTSPPLTDIVAEINEESNNFVAEQLLKTLGTEVPAYRRGVEPGSAEAGAIVIRRLLGDIGIDTTDIQLVDGSGLSRVNLVTPQAMVGLLRYMWNHPDPHVRRAFYESLPVGGREGTLESRFTSGPARGKVRAKTGSFSNTRSLSGYVTTASQTPVAFSIMLNNYTTTSSKADQAINHIVELLAQYAP